MTPESLAATHKAAFGDKGWTAEDIIRLTATGGTAIYGDASSFAILRRAGGEAEVLTVATHPEAQGKGLATAALHHALTAEAAAGTTVVFLEVAADNTPALSLYRRAGFEQIAERKDYYRLPGGGRVTALVLRKILDHSVKSAAT